MTKTTTVKTTMTVIVMMNMMTVIMSMIAVKTNWIIFTNRCDCFTLIGFVAICLPACSFV